jgi:O-antigen ligase
MNHGDLRGVRSANVLSPRGIQLLLDGTLFCALMVALTPNSAAYIIQSWTGILTSPGPVAALLVFCLGLYVYMSDQKPDSIRIFIYIAFATILYFCFTGLWSSSRIYLSTKLFYTLTLAPTMLISGLAIGNSHIRIIRLFKSLIIFGVVLCLTTSVFGLAQASQYDEFDLSTAHAGYQGISRMLGLSVCAVLAILFSGKMPSYQRIFLVLLTVLFSATLIQTGGRTGIAIIVSFLAFYGLVRLKALGKTLLIFTVLVAMVVSSTDYFSNSMLVLATDESMPATIQRISFYLSPLGESYKYEYSRAFYQIIAAEMFWEHPLLGIGWGGFPVYGGYGDVANVYPHNLFYEIACETGVVGLVLLAVFLGRPIAASLKMQSSDPWHGAVTGFFGVGIIVAMIVSDFSTQRELLLFLGLLAAYTSGKSAFPIESR